MAGQKENRKRKQPCEISSLCHRRHQTLHKKAEELEEIDVKVCIVSYDTDGNLGLWPEDKREARAIMMQFKEADKRAKLSRMRGSEVRISDMLGGKINKMKGKKKGKMEGQKKDFEGFDDCDEKGFEGFEDRGEKGFAMWDDEDLGQLGELHRDSLWCITRLMKSRIQTADEMVQSLLRDKAIQPYNFNNVMATTPNFSVDSGPAGPRLPISGYNYHNENRIVRDDFNGDFGEMGEKISNDNPTLLGSFAQSSNIYSENQSDFEAADNLAANLMRFESCAENNNVNVGGVINPPQTLISSWGRDLTHVHQRKVSKRPEALPFSVWPESLQYAMSNVF
ncbi:uncharacterized protein [Pyrus communis]|uniref:uncharacterized protein n=1 Tax=Pyrus communis TaxID=23211 RepID=UPI0035C261B6